MAFLKLSTVSRVSISTIATIRVLLGGSMLLGPQSSAKLFGIPLTPETSIAGQLFGARDLALGALLWYARSSVVSYSKTLRLGDAAASNDVTGILKYALYTGLAVDMMDIGACAVAYSDGLISDRAAAFFGGGAVFVATLAGVGLRGL
jgi:hypothetical protein